MPVLVLFSGSHCQKEPVIRELLALTGYALVTDADIIQEVANDTGCQEKRVTKALFGEPSIFNKVTREKERAIGCLRQHVARRLKQGGVLFDGFSGLLIPENVTHVLKVCLISKMADRVSQAASSQGVSARQAEKIIQKDDAAAAAWMFTLFQKTDPWDPSRFDLVIPMDTTGVEKASLLIEEKLLQEAVLPTEVSRQAVDDFIMASDIETLLLKNGHHVAVNVENGAVTLSINRKVLRLKRLSEELQSIIRDAFDVASIEIEIGRDFHQSDVYRKFDFDRPTKLLLVDDEREFIQTLSERLEMREMGSVVVNDGRTALEIVERDAPDVMIIDLKMEGVTGMDVLRNVKETHPHIEVIVITGHGDDRHQQICMDLGAFAYLQKPVDMEQLAETLKKAYRKARDRAGE